jgi:alanine racemase
VEINRAHLAHNVRAVKQRVGRDVALLAVVKANGYGHGAAEVARIALAHGATYLGVTSLAEGEELRAAGIDAPVLVFGPPLPDQAADLVALELTATVTHVATAQALGQAAQEQRRRVRVHVKVDTGMGRFGALPEEVPELVAAVRDLPALEVEGLYTHFATAFQRDKAYTRQQFATFQRVLENLPHPPPLRHCANSAALLDLPETHLDLVRCGTLLYGQYPSAEVSHALDLQPTWALKTRIVELRRLPAGWRIGYGSEYVTSRPTLLATLLVGYAEGLSLAPASVLTRPRALLQHALRKPTETVTLRGQKAPIVGRISMQTCTVDVTDVPGVQLGDEVLLSARRVTVPRGVPRVYVE